MKSLLMNGNIKFIYIKTIIPNRVQIQIKHWNEHCLFCSWSFFLCFSFIFIHSNAYTLLLLLLWIIQFLDDCWWNRNICWVHNHNYDHYENGICSQICKCVQYSILIIFWFINSHTPNCRCRCNSYIHCFRIK